MLDQNFWNYNSKTKIIQKKTYSSKKFGTIIPKKKIEFQKKNLQFQKKL